MEICGDHDQAFSGKLSSLCTEIGATSRSGLSPQTAAFSIEGMIEGLWQNFLIGAAGFKRVEALAMVFELLRIIFPDKSHDIHRLSVSSN